MHTAYDFTAIPTSMDWIEGTLAAIAAAHHSSKVQWHLSVADQALAYGKPDAALASIARAMIYVTENPEALMRLAALAEIIYDGR